MNRYEMDVVLRPHDPGTDRDGPEEHYRAKVPATCGLLARREVLERAWATGYLVSSIYSFHKKVG